MPWIGVQILQVSSLSFYLAHPKTDEFQGYCCHACEKWQKEGFKRKTFHGPRCLRKASSHRRTFQTCRVPQTDGIVRSSMLIGDPKRDPPHLQSCHVPAAILIPKLGTRAFSLGVEVVGLKC
ncbi:PEAMT [Symbiodinium natans]|uniref:PEAMT protein n=1 Tax=Symbiodinium natans TaxID=878477 RepID=A0A812SQ76_9DINO|nr:PEAMT [Symbiodinium natans]